MYYTHKTKKKILQFKFYSKNVNSKVLKQICVGVVDPGETIDAMQEAKLLSKLKHASIVQFFESFVDGQFFCISLEYCEVKVIKISYFNFRYKSKQ